MDTPKCLEVNEVQAVFLELMEEFHQLCQDHGLRYDLGGGSLLGAVRHRGFIPWDNDIDVNMPRPDYERLLQLQQAGELKLSAQRQLVSDRDGTFARHFSRYVRHDIRRLTTMAEDWDCPFIGMDIFPIDGVPANDGAFKRQVFTIRQLRRFLLTCVEKPNTSRRGKLAAKVKNCYRPLLRKIGPFRLAARLDQACSRVNFDSAEFVGGISGMYGMKEKWRKADFLPRTLLDFEGRKFYGPANYHIYLSNLYGDYMQLPPEEKQIPHCDQCYRVPAEEA